MNRFDFRLDNPKWDIKIFREGDHLGENRKWFVGNWKYASWTPHDVADWLIIGCRTSLPRRYSKFPLPPTFS